MSKQDLSAGLLPSGPSHEAGWASLIEIGLLDRERMLLVDLYNDVADFIRHRKVSVFRRLGLYNIIELRYNTLEDGYAVFPGGFYLIERSVMVVS